MSKLGIAAIGAALALASSAGVMAVSGLGMVSLVPGATTQTAQADVPTTRRCTECGWIESKRDMPGGTDSHAIRIREYTVRMADGSRRVFIGGPDDRWRLGESLTFIDGDRRPERKLP